METTAPPAHQRNNQVYYTCGKCAQHLFFRSQVHHEGTAGSKANDLGVSTVKATWAQSENTYKGVGGNCSSVFLADAPDWADNIAGHNGRISCPKCKARVGSFSWSGAPCSCGKWVTPAFQFQLSRIDPKGIISLPVNRGGDGSTEVVGKNGGVP